MGIQSTEWVTIALGITIAAVAARVSVAWIGASMDSATDARVDASDDPDRMAPVSPLPMSRKRRAMSGGGDGGGIASDDTVKREHERNFEPASIGPHQDEANDIGVDGDNGENGDNGEPVDVADVVPGDDGDGGDGMGLRERNAKGRGLSCGPHESRNPSISRGWFNAWNNKNG